MYCDNILLLVLVLALLCMFSGRDNVNGNAHKLCKVVIVLVVLWFLYSMSTSEGFHFEVSPWKLSCINDRAHRCPGCCSPGFYGQKVSFDYTGDAERLNNCPVIKKYGEMNSNSSYIDLGNYEEAYCNNCQSGNVFNTIGNYMQSTLGPVEPKYSAVYGPAPAEGVTGEGYCGSCAGV